MNHKLIEYMALQRLQHLHSEAATEQFLRSRRHSSSHAGVTAELQNISQRLSLRQAALEKKEEGMS